MTIRMNNQPLLKVSNITHTFTSEDGKKIEVLRDVSFEVSKGEFFTILGPSGCGKSTMLRIIAGMIQPLHGRVEFLDHSESNVSMIFQSFALFPWLSIYENVEFGLKMKGVSDHARAPIVHEHIQEIGLQGFTHAYPKDLSGGMKQRVGIARALTMNPKVLLMDEPFSALDAFTAEKLREEILSLWAKDKITIIMVTHSVEEAVQMSDRVLVMTPRPGEIEEAIEIDISRPRSKRAPEFFALMDKISGIIKL